MITKLMVSGFKSLDLHGLPLGRLNLFLGPNAAGKSNIVKAIRFLRDIVKIGDLRKAVAANGGIDSVRCLVGRRSKPIRFEIEAELVKPSDYREYYRKLPPPTRFRYVLSFSSNPAHPLRIQEERLEWVRLRSPLKVVFDRTNSQVTIARDRVFQTARRSGRLEREDEGVPLISRPLASFPVVVFHKFLAGIRVYNVDPAMIPHFSTASAAEELDEDGTNLAQVLVDINRTKGKNGIAEGLRDFMKCAVPEFAGIDAEPIRGAGANYFAALIEEISKCRLRLTSISDGTIRLLCFFLALMYHREPVSLVCFEEPETSIHPHILEPMVDLIKYHPRNLQVLMTSHSSVLANLLEPKNVFLVSKEKGMTKVQRAYDRDEIERFCRRYGIGEAWLRGLIGATP